MSRQIVQVALLLLAAFLFLAMLSAQQAQTPQKTTQTTPPSYAAIPAAAAKQANPVKSSPESLARAKKWWGMDCAMCHGTTGDGKGEVATGEKLAIVDLTDPATLKDRTDGEIYYIIKNGHQDMPGEGDRIKTDDGWDLVNFVRSLAKPKPEAEQKP
jgi:mono/diheme cytochrome c family protein